MNNETYTVSYQGLDAWLVTRIKVRLAEAAKVAQKLGLTAPVLAIVANYTKSVQSESALGGSYKVPVVDVEITGQLLCIPGFKLVGALTNEADVLLVLSIPGVEADLSAHRSWKGHCDHCNKVRSRKSALVFEEEATGLRKVVGSSCVREYTGAELNPDAILSYALSGNGWGGNEDEDGFISYGKCKVVHSAAVLWATALIVRLFGYKSQKQAGEQGGVPTSLLVATFLDQNGREAAKDLDKEIKKLGGTTEADAVLAAQLADFAKDLNPKNDYQWSLKALAAAEQIPSKRIGFLVSIYGAYSAAQAYAAKDAQRVVPQGFIGTIGQRLVVEAEVERVHYSEGQYGCTTILSLVDAQGHKLVWFASGSKDYTKGTKLAGKATIKAHKQDAKWGDSTILTRCAF